MALQDFRLMMERCSSCSYCKWVPLDKVKSNRFAEGCPSVAYNHFNAYSARGRFQFAFDLLEGITEYTDKAVEVINACMTCGACDVSCKICRYNLEPLEHHIELKTDTVEKGYELPQLKAVIENLKKEGTMQINKVKADRGAWAEGLKVKDLSKEKAEVMFFAGCRYSYDKNLWKVPRAAVEILIKAGVDLGIFGKNENCCAGRANSMGYRAVFNEVADSNLKAWQAAGVKTIVTSCSDCYHSLKRLYTKKGSSIKVLHTLEYLDQLIKEGKIQFTKQVPLTVTYHDPCHLGRQGEEYIPWEGTEKKIRGQIITWEPRKPRYNGAYGIYDAPRDVLNSIPGVKLVEMERIREYAWCCGAGGGCSDAYPDFAAWTAGERITEAKATGAEAIVTACPWCEQSFTYAVGEDGVKMKVYDIVELVQQAL
jgi:Fe-S oxidoreductase